MERLGENGSHAHRRGDVVIRESGPWSETVFALLRHLESEGFEGAPRVVGSGFDDHGNETLSYIEGVMEHPGPMSIDAAAGVARLLRRLHDVTASWRPTNAMWRDWFGRSLGLPTVVGHCDVGPWNVIVRPDGTVAIIDWECAGPVDPLVDLAHACWLCANLYSDDIVAMNGMPTLEVRAGQLRAMADAYGLRRGDRQSFVQLMIDFAIHSAAADADEHNVTPATRESPALWGMAWRARSAAWMARNRETLEAVLR
jgi:hypothetical protein